MPNLSYFLERIEQLSDTIETLEFSKPGIFTNAFVKAPPITTLLKDVNANEQQLYTIEKQIQNRYFENYDVEIKPVRVDGRSYYVDNNSNEYLNQDEFDYDDHHRRPPAVSIPQLTRTTFKSSATEYDGSSSPTRSKLNKLMEIHEIYDTLITLINRVPNAQSMEQLNDIKRLKPQFESLIKEIEQYENNDYLISSSTEDYESRDLDKEINDEELEIAAIEKELKSYGQRIDI